MEELDAMRFAQRHKLLNILFVDCPWIRLTPIVDRIDLFWKAAITVFARLVEGLYLQVVVICTSAKNFHDFSLF